MTISMNDFCGQPMNVGDIIVYGHALGRCAALKIGKILKLSATNSGTYYTGEARMEYRITVQGVESESRYDHATNTHSTVNVLCRKGTLQFPDRCMVVDPRKVPVDIKTLLDGVQP